MLDKCTVEDGKEGMDPLRSEEEPSRELLLDPGDQFDAAEQLVDVSEQLVDGSEQLVDAAEQLVDAAEQLVDGPEQLVDASGQLVDMLDVVVATEEEEDYTSQVVIQE